MGLNSLLYLVDEKRIRDFVLLSLSLQVFLILFAPIKKKTVNNLILFLLSLAYLMSECIIALAMALISYNLGSSSDRIAKLDDALLAFWASFLLLHLGGPDNIIAFSLDESLHWRQYPNRLIGQIIATIYVFTKTFPHDKSLLIPTMLVFLAGVIKNAERSTALRVSRAHLLKRHSFYFKAYDNMCKVTNALENEYFAKEEETGLSESIVVKHAHNFFLICKIFIRDLILARQEREMSRKYFCKVSAMDALRVMSVELHFLYELLYTKGWVIHSMCSYIFRFVALASMAMAFILFNRLKKHWLPEIDVEITYSLLFGGIALEVIALFMHIFSDWSITGMKCYRTGSSKRDLFLHMLVLIVDILKKPRFATYKVKSNVVYEALDTPFIFRRWSESISTCNLLFEMCNDSPRNVYKSYRHWGIISCFHRSNKIAALHDKPVKLIGGNMKYVYKNPFIIKLWIFIFEKVRCITKDADDPMKARKIFNARGDLFLKNEQGDINCNLLEYVTKSSYHINIFVWHIATEMWYKKDGQHMSPTSENDEMEFSKILSDYMFYLLIMQPNVVSDAADVINTVLWETSLELRFNFRNSRIKDVEELCEKLFEGCSETMHQRSRLQKAIDLANEMESLGKEKWRVMSRVWIAMLSYAAIHTKGHAHMEMLSKGGELLTFVWLLMAHLGCVYRPKSDTSYDQSDDTSSDHSDDTSD